MADSLPFVSVIVPTHARPDSLRACLSGVCRCTYPRERFEVIVVSDGDAAASESLVREACPEVQTALVRRPRGGPGAARNTGAERARGELLAFIDDDCVPAAGWLNALARAYRDGPDRLLGGRVENGLEHNVFATASQLITTYTYRYYDRHPDAERFFTTNNFAVAADSFRRLGGFETRVPSATAEDKEFCGRWRATGRGLEYVPAAVVSHAHPLDAFSFLRQHYEYGRGILCVRVMNRNGRRRLRPEPLRFYFDLFLHPIREGHHRRWRLAALLAFSQIATAAGAVRAALFDVRALRRASS